MSVYLGYDTVTKQYLKSLAGGVGSGGAGLGSGGSSVDISGFTMSGDIDMGSNRHLKIDVYGKRPTASKVFDFTTLL